MGKIATVPALGEAWGAVVFSQFFWRPRCSRLTRLLTDGIWVPVATVHFAALTAALLAGWMAVRAKVAHSGRVNATDLSSGLLPGSVGNPE